MWHQKQTYFKYCVKQLGVENVSLCAEVHPNISDHLIEVYTLCQFSQNGACGVQNVFFYSKNVKLQYILTNPA
jgi:hypothetical protein